MDRPDGQRRHRASLDCRPPHPLPDAPRVPGLSGRAYELLTDPERQVRLCDRFRAEVVSLLGRFFSRETLVERNRAVGSPLLDDVRAATMMTELILVSETRNGRALLAEYERRLAEFDARPAGASTTL